MNIQIKQISNKYSIEVINLVLPIQQIEFNVPITLDDQPDLLDLESNYYAAGGAFWGAFIDGELVGTIAMIKYDVHAAAIRKMFVKKEFRGGTYKIGQLLLETLMDYSKENKINNLSLGTVHILAAAIRFYEKNGFRPIAKEELSPLFPRMAADDTFYQLNLL